MQAIGRSNGQLELFYSISCESDEDQKELLKKVSDLQLSNKIFAIAFDYDTGTGRSCPDLLMLVRTADELIVYRVEKTRNCGTDDVKHNEGAIVVELI